MDRRKFLIGMGALTAGGAAALGTGAFSRVESNRAVNIEVAADPDAYLGLVPMDTPNGNNYVGLDDNGHLFIDIGEHDDFDPSEYPAKPGQGVNSDSYTWFDGLFEICNQGKDDADVSYDLGDAVQEENETDDQTVAFYWIDDQGNRVLVEEGQEVPLELGDCVEIGLRTATHGINAANTPIVDGDVIVTADSPGAGEEAD